MIQGEIVYDTREAYDAAIIALKKGYQEDLLSGRSPAKIYNYEADPSTLTITIPYNYHLFDYDPTFLIREAVKGSSQHNVRLGATEWKYWLEHYINGDHFYAQGFNAIAIMLWGEELTDESYGEMYQEDKINAVFMPMVHWVIGDWVNPRELYGTDEDLAPYEEVPEDRESAEPRPKNEDADPYNEPF